MDEYAELAKDDGKTKAKMRLSAASSLAAWCEASAVACVFSIFVLFRAADRVFLKRVVNALGPTYSIMSTNFIWPVAIQVMTALMITSYVAYLRTQGHRQYTWRFFLPGSAAASSTGAVPLFQFALFSLGDQLNAAISAPSTPFISIPMQSVMSNLMIVWMAILAFFWLHTRFRLVHSVGCFLVLASIFVGVSGQIFDGDCSEAGMAANRCLTAYKNGSGVWVLLSTGQTMLWYGLFIFSTLPASVGSIYKQKVLQDRNVDIMYATWWSGNFQVLWGWLLIWVTWIPLPGQEVIPPDRTLAVFADTCRCFYGLVPHEGDESCAAGSFPPIFWFAIYLCFNLTFNMAGLWLTKRMSAVWAQVATVLCLDVTNILGQSRFFVGRGGSSMSIYDWIATAIASAALWIYNLESEGRPSEKRAAVCADES